MSSDDKSLVGQVVLGRYRVLRRLALGGMGAVYLARTEGARGFSKPVVIKRILPIWGGDEEIVSLFAREARILSQLQDPGIVNVMDFGPIADGTLVMVLDYVHGYHLAHWLAYLRKTQGSMPVEMAVHIMLRVLAALHYAHTFTKPDGKALAVIHRDVSPGNILLDVSGHVKLVDFGIARVEGDSNEYKTEAPQLRGKFGFLAPELFSGSPPTAQSDVYSAGVVLYELLTGSNPFRSRELTEAYHKVQHVTAQPVNELRSDASARLAQIIDTAIAKDPARRYSSAAAFADALREERPAPDEVCQGRLRSAVQVAFAGPLAETLGIEPLTAADEAWREAVREDTSQSLATATAEPPSPVTPGRGVATVLSPMPPMAALESPLELAEVGTTLREPSIPSPKSPLSPVQLRWVAIASMVLFGSLIVAGVLRSLDHKQEQVIVIEREANAAPQVIAEVTKAQEAVSGAPTAMLREGAVLAADAPVGPDPALLTSAFAPHQAHVQRCFASHAHGASAPGDVRITFHVAVSGAVERAEVLPDQVASSALGTCLAELARSTRFPRLTHAVTFQIPIYSRVAPPQ